MPDFRCVLIVAGLAALAAPVASAQGLPPPDLTQVTLEELMEIRVTSAARKSQRAEDVPAAVYVITSQDIRQSGLATLPEILRLAPGVQVAQVNANKWAISIRGFNDIYSNKLLVLVDGRSVYTRSFSGVWWDLQDLMLADIDRIEVIRGPGGAVWGANAVNGIINIITRPASDTMGVAVAAAIGTASHERVSVRYGGALGDVAYRVYSQWSDYARGDQAALPLDDRWHSLTSGLRADWTRGADAVLAQSHFTANTTRPGWLALEAVPGAAPVTDGVSTGHEVSVLGRWTRTRADGGILQLQGYHSTVHRREAIGDLSERSSDVDAQYETSSGRHGLVIGGGFRHVGMTLGQTFTLQLGSSRARTLNVFAQDDIALRPGLSLTLGSRVEHDTFGGWGLMPSARAIWEVRPGQHVWAAISRTRRTQALTDRSARVNIALVPGPGLPVALGYWGNPSYRPESLVQTEGGYRFRFGSHSAMSVTAFTGSYEGLPTWEPQPPVLALTPVPHLQAGRTFANLLNARSSGVEVDGHWTPLPVWQVSGSYSLLRVTGSLDAASTDVESARTDGKAPAHQWQARTAVRLPAGLLLSGSVSRVAALRTVGIPAHTRADARAEFRLSRKVTAAFVGQNLTARRHLEFASDVLVLGTAVPRSARLELRWGF